jgi:nucleoside-diphosphate-sugar epimerase
MDAVIGASGKLGSRIVSRLAAHAGGGVVAIARNSPRTPLPTSTRFHSGDVRDIAFLRDALNGCTRVFLLAAVRTVSEAASRPYEAFGVNVAGAAAVAEACRDLGIAHCVFASTVHVYAGGGSGRVIDEGAPIAPASWYAATKLLAEETLRAFARHHAVRFTVARCANLFAPEDGDETVVGRALAQIAAGRPIQLRDLAARADFLDVEDAAEALVRLSALSDPPALVNLASGRLTSVGDIACGLADAAVELGLPRPEVLPTDRSSAGPDDRPTYSAALLGTLTGWAPTPLPVSLRRTLSAKLGIEAPP